MPDKSFETAIQFFSVPTPTGIIVRLPLVTVTLIQPNGTRIDLPLMFDTGASTTTLRHDLYPLLGLTNWDVGQPLQTLTAGSAAPIPCYRYQTTLEFLGKAVTCPIHLQVLPAHPLYVGLFGREGIFDRFGFGFWESTHEIYATTSP